MKKPILFFALLFLSVSAYCQSSVKSNDSTYCEVICKLSMINVNLVSEAKIDYGAGPQEDVNLSAFLKESKRRVQVLNYMAKNGWKLVSSEVFEHQLIYIMEKK